LLPIDLDQISETANLSYSGNMIIM